MNQTLPDSRMKVRQTIASPSVPIRAASCAAETVLLSTQRAEPASDRVCRIEVRLIRKSELLEKVPFSKSTLHAKLDPRSPYHDPSMPRPRYLDRSRIPMWNRAEVDAWLAKIFGTDTNAERA